jgi:urea transport system ATP-binding protein
MVEENLRIGLAVRRATLREVPEHLYQMFPALKQMLGPRGGDLSGGQQQQLAIARAGLRATCGCSTRAGWWCPAALRP